MPNVNEVVRKIQSAKNSSEVIDVVNKADDDFNSGVLEMNNADWALLTVAIAEWKKKMGIE